MKQVRNTKPKYGFRKIKYVAGLASAMLASVSLSTAKPQTVHADTNTNNLQDNRATGEKSAEEELDHIPDNPNSKTQTPSQKQTSQKRTVHIIDDSTQQDLKQEKPVKNTPNVNKSNVPDKEVETPKTADKDYIPDNPKDSPNKTVSHVDNTVDNNTVQTADKDYIPDNPKDSPNKTVSHVDNTVDNNTVQTADNDYIQDNPKDSPNKTVSHVDNTVDNNTVQTTDISTAALDLKKKQITTKSAKMAKLSNNLSLDNTSLFSLNDVNTTNPNTVDNALNVNDAVDNALNDAYALNPRNNLHEHANVNVNGGYDTNTWGNLDVSKWQGSIQGNYYQLTGYNGDPNNIIVPNEADFEKAGISTAGKQVGINSDFMHSLAQKATRIGLSKTNNEKIVASDSDWRNAFSGSQYGAPNLTQMDLHNLDTHNITTMAGMFNDGINLTTVGDLSNWNTSNVTDMSYMFANASGLTNIGDLDNWNTGNVTNMEAMFDRASGLTNIGNLGNWNTGNVKYMGLMFRNAVGLTNIGDLSHWQTGNVTDMGAMFQDTSGLTNIGDLSHWQTGNVTNMGYMFSNFVSASKLTNIGNLGNWNTSNVTDMRYMFSGASGLTNIGDLSNWNTGNVTNMYAMFDRASGLTNIGNLGNWNTGNVKYMGLMFRNAVGLTNIGDLSHWQTGNVTDMGAMFQDTSGLTNIGDLSHWQTGNVTNMGYMFSNFVSASKLTNIGNLGNWNTSNVTDMRYMFANASLTNIGDLSNWNTGNVTNMSYMFYNASGLTNIGNLGNWNTGNVKYMGLMFNGASGLTNIGDLSHWQTGNVTDMSSMFSNASGLTNIGNLDNWNTSNVTNMIYMFNGASGLTNIGHLDNWNTGNVKNMSAMFSNASKLTNIGNLNNWNTGNVTNMKAMFGGASGLTNIGNLNNWNTSNVTDMSYMFNGASGLTNIGDLSHWQTGNVTDMSSMFSNASGLTNIGNLDNWNTSNVTNMIYMFNGASGLTNIGHLDNWNTGNVKNMSAMFSNASKLTNIGNLDNWNTSNVTDMIYMFNGASGLTNIGDLSHWQTGNVTDMSSMFSNASGLTNIGNLDNWNTSNVTNMIYMFNGASGLTNIGHLDNWNTGNVKNMSAMFSNASKLTNIGNLNNWNTSNVTNTSYMFNEASDLTNIGDLSHWQTGNVTNMQAMFQNASKLTNIGDLSHWQTGNVTDMSSMFSNASSLTNIGDLSHWQTGNVKAMSYMFSRASSLTNIGNLDNWNTGNVTDMSYMFTNALGLTNIGDLSHWQTGNVTNMKAMFGGALGLTNIGDLSHWQTGNVTDMSYMFSNASSLTNIGNLDNWNTGNVIYMNNMFTNALGLTNIGDLSHWQTGNVTDMSYMFTNALGLTNIGDLSHWQTGNVTNMKAMFTNALGLTNIGDLSHWQTGNVTDMSYMFGGASDLTNIGDLSHWQTGNVTDMSYMFSNAKKLCLIINNTNGWQHINDGDGEALDGVPVVITNNANILKAKDDSAYTIDSQSISRSAVFDSSKSPIASQPLPTYKQNMTPQEQDAYAANVVKLYNQKVMQDYTKDHLDKIIYYAPDQNMNDPRKLVTAAFITTSKIQVCFVDDDNNEKVVGNDTVLGITNKDLVVNPINDLNIPANYVPINFDKFDYGIVQDNNNKAITIHVKHKIIGTVDKYQENAHNERDYLINKIKSHQVKDLIDGLQDDSNKDLDQLSSNISIVQDPDQTYTAKYNDDADINNKLNQINNDYIQQQNDLINQFKDWYNKAQNAQAPNQAPKLELHYHNDNLHLIKTSTYQVIEKMPHPIIDPNKYGNDQVILKTTITAGKDIARDMVTGETKQTKFLGKYTTGIVDKGHTDGVDQTVIWGSDVGLPGYELDPFYTETKEQYDVPNSPTSQGAVLSVSDSNNTIHFNYLVGKNYQNANGVEMSDFPDDQTWYVTMHPLAQHANIVYVDNDTNETVKTTPLQGVTDEQINLTYEAPANYTITPDQDLPNNYLFTASDNSDIDVWLNHATQPTTQTHTAKRIFKLQFNGQDIKHDYVQTGTITRTGNSNNGNYSLAQWNEITKDDLTKLYQQYGYQTNGHDFTLDGNKFTTINTVEIDPDTQDETHIINVVPTKRPINYIDIATNNTIESDSVQGVANDVIKYTPNVPDGYELVTPQDSYNIPILGDNTPFDIYIKSSMIHVDHTKPHHQGELIYDDTQPNMVYPNNVDYDDLNQILTRTINVYEPDGVITQIVQKVVLYRDADYDLAHHTTTYTPWQANGPRSWDSYTAPDFDGYTPDLSHISAATPLPDSQDITINIHYKETGSEVVLAYNDIDESGTEVARYNEGGKPNSTIQIDWLNHMTQDMPGYEIVPGQVINGQHLDDLLKNHASLTYALSDVNKPIVINIRHIDSDVTNTDPKAKSSSERTLTIIEPNGHKIVYTQHIDFIRTATRDQATGLVSYGDWHVSGGYESDTNGGYTAINANNNSTYTVDSINIPAFANYETQSNILDNKGNTLTNPNTDNILPSITVSPDSPTRNYLVTYHKMNYDYFGDNNKQHVDSSHSGDGSTNSQISNSNKVDSNFVKNAINLPNYTPEALNKQIGNVINTDLQSVTKNSIKDVYHYVPHFAPTTVKIYTYVPHFAPTVIKTYQSIPTFGAKLRKANTVNPALLGFTQSKIQVQKPHNLATLGLMTTMLGLLSK